MRSSNLPFLSIYVDFARPGGRPRGLSRRTVGATGRSSGWGRHIAVPAKAPDRLMNPE